MKNTIIRYINLFLLLVIIISIIYLAYYNSQKEGFTTTDDLDYYVVSMSNADRLKNIQTQNEKLKSQTQNNEDNRCRRSGKIKFGRTEKKWKFVTEI